MFHLSIFLFNINAKDTHFCYFRNMHPEHCLKDVPGSGHYGIPELIAILFIVALHKWKKSTLLSIGGGTVLYMVLVQTIFG